MEIRFYHPIGKYGCFSNFSEHPLSIDNKIWPTAEHYFQAQKFSLTSPEHAEKIRLVVSPTDALRLGRERTYPIRHDWEEIKDDVMRLAVAVKFSSHSDLEQKLLSTGDAHIIEAAPHDFYWGEGNGSGKNMLGKILMEVRSALRTENIPNYKDTLGKLTGNSGL
ncbi:MAG: NADAR family protein [Nanoarchaeota archaeon]